MPIHFLAYLSAVWFQNKRTVSFAVLLGLFLLFSDTFLPIIGHFLHILLEIVESILEHFLESVFGMSERQAQITLFYSAVVIISYLSWYFVCKAYLAVQNMWRLIKAKPWFKTVLIFGAFGATFYIFS